MNAIRTTTPFRIWQTRYLLDLEARNYSAYTVRNRSRSLATFFDWAEVRGLDDPAEVTRAVLERFQQHLFRHRKRDGRPLSPAAQHERLTHLKSYFGWLAKRNVITGNPASDLDLPRVGRRLPQDVLTTQEIETLLEQPDVGTEVGIRDRAILEVLYSTAMRRLEVTTLKVTHVDFGRESVMIREGKGDKDRLVPISKRALAWITAYLDEVRPQHALAPDDGVLFLSTRGAPLDPNTLSKTVRRYLNAAGIEKSGSCHQLRRAVATGMAENGASILEIAALLGHADTRTTSVYVNLSMARLREVFERTHPGLVDEDGEDEDE